MVVSGEWSFGYGPAADTGGLARLPAGSVYTEPANRPHFAETGETGATVVISGDGPSDTTFEVR